MVAEAPITECCFDRCGLQMYWIIFKGVHLMTKANASLLRNHSVLSAGTVAGLIRKHFNYVQKGTSGSSTLKR